jgi:hypothetical protein
MVRRRRRRGPSETYETYDGTYRDGGSTRADHAARETSMRRAHPQPPQHPIGGSGY